MSDYLKYKQVGHFMNEYGMFMTDAINDITINDYTCTIITDDGGRMSLITFLKDIDKDSVPGVAPSCTINFEILGEDGMAAFYMSYFNNEPLSTRLEMFGIDANNARIVWCDEVKAFYTHIFPKISKLLFERMFNEQRIDSIMIPIFPHYGIFQSFIIEKDYDNEYMTLYTVINGRQFNVITFNVNTFSLRNCIREFNTLWKSIHRDSSNYIDEWHREFNHESYVEASKLYPYGLINISEPW